MNLSVNITNYGYILSNESAKYVFNRTKKDNSKVDYYLKQVKPNEMYISGMYYDKNRKQYNGKTIDGKRIYLKIDGSLCNLEIK